MCSSSASGRLLHWLPLFAAMLCLAIGGFAAAGPGPRATPGKVPQAAAAQPRAGEWQSLFDGKSLQGWRETPFSGRGKVRVEDGTILLGAGALTGITWAGSFPRSNYEVRLEAARMDGTDFFAGITFPVKEAYCSWINGGWGGLVVGLSSLDGRDASENETMIQRNFTKGRWYALRLRVTDDRIQAWIDNEQIIDVALEGREISLRPGQIDLSAPFGIASYSTVGALRKIEYRVLAQDNDKSVTGYHFTNFQAEIGVDSLP
jgi:hypothetical protein